MATDFGVSHVPADLAEDDLDRRLILAFQRGEKEAYQAIHRRHAAKVERICRRMLGNPDDAKDAEQETFLRTYKALARFNGRYRVGAWITRIATNVCLDQLRARARWRWEEMPAELVGLERHGFDEGADPESIHIRRAEGRRIGRLLNSLSPLHRATIVLRDFEGLSYEEIASALEMTECQVKALLHRARKGFRRSWNSGRLAGLVSLPWLRRVQDGARDPLGHGVHAAQTADFAASVSNLAESCSTTLHHCGQLLTERAAAVVTTVALGTAAAVTGVMSLPASPQPSQSTGTGVVASVAGSPQRDGTDDAKGVLVAEGPSTSGASTTAMPTSAESTTAEPGTVEPAPSAEAPEAPPSAAEQPPPSGAAPSEPAPSESPPPSEPPPTGPPASEEPPTASEDPLPSWEEAPASMDGQPLAGSDTPPPEPGRTPPRSPRERDLDITPPGRGPEMAETGNRESET
jgi:RNA polymerase sigma-70 factor (ECF subfamily)